MPRAWFLPLAAVAAIVGSAYLGWLSRSILADLIAWWPLWLALSLAAFLTRGRTLGRVFVSGLVPLFTVVCLLAFLIGHLVGWSTMPSASVRLVGPRLEDREPAAAALSAHPDGELVVAAADTGFLYTVLPLRRGGGLGLPTAREQTRPGEMAIVLTPDPDPGWYAFAGWRVLLAPEVSWNLSLGGEMDADLVSLRLSALQLEGRGTVALGAVSSPVPVTISGEFTVTIPREAPARVVGEAEVPEGWAGEDGVWTSPYPGEGWVISVAEGSTLTLIGR